MYSLSEIDTSRFNTEQYRYELYEHMDGVQWLAKRITLNDLNSSATYANAETTKQTFVDYAAVAATLDTLTYQPVSNLLYYN